MPFKVIDIEYGVEVEVVVDVFCVVVFVDEEVVVVEEVVLDVVCEVVLVAVEVVLVFDVVCVVVFTDEVVMLAAVIIVLYVVWVVLLPDEQLNASMLTSMARTMVNTKQQWAENPVIKNGAFVFTLLSNGRYRRFPLCPRDFLGNPPAETPYDVFRCSARRVG